MYVWGNACFWEHWAKTIQCSSYQMHGNVALIKENPDNDAFLINFRFFLEFVLFIIVWCVLLFGCSFRGT